MAAAEPTARAARASAQTPRPTGAPGRTAGAAGPRSGRSGGGVPQQGERTSAAVEKRGPYVVTRAPSIQAKLQKHRDLAKAVLRRKGMLGASPNPPDSSGKRSVKFNKGYTSLSQSPDENLVSLDSDRVAWLENSRVMLLLLDLERQRCLGDSSCPVTDGELESRYSSGYSSAEQVNQEVSRQLLQDGYHLDEIPDDEDLDLIPPKPMTSSTCSCCWCCLGDSSSCTLQ